MPSELDAYLLHHASAWARNLKEGFQLAFNPSEIHVIPGIAPGGSEDKKPIRQCLCQILWKRKDDVHFTLHEFYYDGDIKWKRKGSSERMHYGIDPQELADWMQQEVKNSGFRGTAVTAEDRNEWVKLSQSCITYLGTLKCTGQATTNWKDVFLVAEVPRTVTEQYGEKTLTSRSNSLTFAKATANPAMAIYGTITGYQFLDEPYPQCNPDLHFPEEWTLATLQKGVDPNRNTWQYFSRDETSLSGPDWIQDRLDYFAQRLPFLEKLDYGLPEVESEEMERMFRTYLGKSTPVLLSEEELTIGVDLV